MLLTVDNHQVYAYTANHAIDASKPTIVFVHGAANDHSVWTLQSRYFAYHGWNVLAADLPGHGKSHGAPYASVGEIADWIIALLEAAKIRKAALVGHSMGSLAALETAARHPERVSSLAMIGAAVPMPVSKPLLDASKADDHAAFEMINFYAHSSDAQIGGNRMPGVWMMGNDMRLMERSGPGVLHADFTACNTFDGGLDAATRVDCPALLILGKRDQMTPAKAAGEVATRFKNARTVILDGAGHALMAERPDEVLDALIGFLRTAP